MPKGRPPRPGGWVYLQLKMDPSLKRAVALAARSERRSMTDWVHLALSRYILAAGPEEARDELVEEMESRSER